MENTTPRNWLIRTGQNQILGPVSKEKIAEFINKGTLGLMDEVSSGNGFWFYIREKELVDRHVFGDVPQGYNPISEAKTVLANHERSDMTTSINAAPINAIDDRRKTTPNSNGAKNTLPSNDDLEYPDLTVVGMKNPIKKEVTNLPTNEDLEYPTLTADSTSELEITIIQARENAPEGKNSDDLSFEIPEEYTAVISRDALKKSEENQVVPNAEDLEYPDLNQVRQAILNETSNKPDKVEPAPADLDRDYTSTIAISGKQLKDILPKKEEVKKSVQPEKKLQLYERKRIVDIKDQDNKGNKSLKAKNPESMRDPRRERAYTKPRDEKNVGSEKRSDNYLFLILFLIILILGAVFYYFKEILNKPFI